MGQKVFNSFTSERLRQVQEILTAHPWELGEQQQLQLREGATGFIGLLDNTNQTYAHIRLTGQTDPSAVIEITSATQDPTTYRQAVAETLAQARTQVDGTIHLWRHQPYEADLTGLGLTLSRALAHMERPATNLAPTPPIPPGITVRPFSMTDVEAFVQLNNAAFAHHPDQGGWTIAQAQERLAQDWVNLNEFYLAEENGTLLAFHWTKHHTKEDGTPAGEVYVIGVHPNAQGRGLGKFMLLYGLNALANGGAQILDLWVDEAETTPYTLYQTMGFTPIHRSHCYTT